MQRLPTSRSVVCGILQLGVYVWCGLQEFLEGGVCGLSQEPGARTMPAGREGCVLNVLRTGEPEAAPIEVGKEAVSVLFCEGRAEPAFVELCSDLVKAGSNVGVKARSTRSEGDVGCGEGPP